MKTQNTKTEKEIWFCLLDIFTVSQQAVMSIVKIYKREKWV